MSNNYLVYISAFQSNNTFDNNMIEHSNLEHKLRQLFKAGNIATCTGKYNGFIELSYEVEANNGNLSTLLHMAKDLNQECVLVINRAKNTGAFVYTCNDILLSAMTKAIKTTVLIAEQDNFSICHGEKFQWLLA